MHRASALSRWPALEFFPSVAGSSCVYGTPIHMDKSPMSLGLGQQPRCLVTIQPVDTHFNQPAQLCASGHEGPPGVLVMRLDNAFQPQWKVTVATSSDPSGQVFIRSSSQGYALYARRERSIEVTKLDRHGSLLATSWADPRRNPELEIIVRFNVLDSRGDTFLAYDAVAVSGRTQKKYARIARVTV